MCDLRSGQIQNISLFPLCVPFPVFVSVPCLLCVPLCVCVCVCVCGVYTAVQKMAEAHMQHLGIYPPMENPYEGEEYDDYRGREEGGVSSLKKATGEAEAMGQRKSQKKQKNGTA